jgi:fumarylacetoacetase
MNTIRLILRSYLLILGCTNCFTTSSFVENGKEYQMTTSNLKYIYWTPIQRLSHHASAMCGLATGDLLGTGTISDGVSTSRVL